MQLLFLTSCFKGDSGEFLLNQQQVNQVLLDIVSAFEDPPLDKYMISAHKSDRFYAQGYIVLIKAFLGAVRKDQILAIAEKRGLSIIDEKDALVVYDPKGTS
jgi:hypothetical protein